MTSPPDPATLARAVEDAADAVEEAWDRCRTANGSILVYSDALDKVERLLVQRRAARESGLVPCWLAADPIRMLRVVTPALRELCPELLRDLAALTPNGPLPHEVAGEEVLLRDLMRDRKIPQKQRDRVELMINEVTQ
jgi:hypothetical protein